jgi:hypothetical protein
MPYLLASSSPWWWMTITVLASRSVSSHVPFLGPGQGVVRDAARLGHAGAAPGRDLPAAGPVQVLQDLHGVHQVAGTEPGTLDARGLSMPP